MGHHWTWIWVPRWLLIVCCWGSHVFCGTVQTTAILSSSPGLRAGQNLLPAKAALWQGWFWSVLSTWAYIAEEILKQHYLRIWENTCPAYDWESSVQARITFFLHSPIKESWLKWLVKHYPDTSTAKFLIDFTSLVIINPVDQNVGWRVCICFSSLSPPCFTQI